MKIFELSDKLIDKENCFSVYYYLPPKFSKNLESSLVISASFTLDGYYEINEISEKIGRQHEHLIREMIKNSRWHGGSKDNFPTYFGMFFNKEGFVFGCNDGGDYFKQEDIKEIWENKKELKKFHESDNKDIGYHIGYDYFKYFLDEIKIDINHGTLYGIVLIKNFLNKLKNKND